MSAKPAVRSALMLGLKTAALTVLFFVCFSAAAVIVGMHDGTAQDISPEVMGSPPPRGSEGGTRAGGAGFFLRFASFCLLNVLVLTFLIVRSRWTGWRLMAAIAFVLYGCMTVMGLLDAALFMLLPSGFLQRMFLMGAITAVSFSVLAVLILGKVRARAPSPGPNRRLVMPGIEWAGKLVVVVAAYLVIYLLFGYFVAWQNPELRQFYRSSASGTFLAATNASHRVAWLIGFQSFRALLWVLLALPIIRMMKGPPWEVALAVGLAFAVLMNTALLLPNPLMPASVRMSHLLETAPSNFLFGCFVAWLLHRRHSRPGSVASINS